VQLLEVECLGKTLKLEGSMAGWQQLFWGEQCVSQVNASADNNDFSHQFFLQNEQGDLQVELNGALQWQPFELQFKLLVNDELLHENILTERHRAKASHPR
jgi:hypothetical protein